MKKVLIVFIIFISFNVSAQDTLTILYKGDTIKITNSKVFSADSLHNSSDSVSIGSQDNKSKFAPPDVKHIISFKKVFWTIIFFLIGYFIIRFITKSIEIWSEKNPERRVKGKSILPIVKIISWFIVIYLIVNGIFHPSYESFFAFGASIGVAIGFASQDILKNVFGGFVILIDRPFKIGDKIYVGDTYGEVLDMSLRSTRIRTDDDSIISYPNGDLMNEPISNSNSGELDCQVVAEIFLPITVNTKKVRKIAIESAKTAKYIYPVKPIAVLFFNEIQDTKPYLKMRLKAYVVDIRYEPAFKSEMTEIVIRELVKEKILVYDNTI